MGIVHCSFLPAPDHSGMGLAWKLRQTLRCGVFTESRRKALEGGHATTRACSRYRYQVSQELRAPTHSSQNCPLRAQRHHSYATIVTCLLFTLLPLLSSLCVNLQVLREAVRSGPRVLPGLSTVDAEFRDMYMNSLQNILHCLSIFLAP